ncbi:endoplasmic reticulum resident protein 29-like isoform X2 [Sycon ciliatum]|uniref:endoplasmic reticulum resident protein 29-like isoform X2 n=1 Tax=Sycon ciliatum TaxID=27933 RepID=UPI0031F67C0B
MARGVSLASCFCYIVVMAGSMVLKASLGSCARGVVELDTLTFHKILSAHNYLIVKFDTSLAYGAAEDAYNSFACLAAKQPEILVASVGVLPHGEKDNKDLANRFSITAEDFPRILLFGHGQSSTAHSLSGNVTVESLVAFAKRYSDLYIALPGCLQEFDQLAARTFHVASSNANTFQLDAKKLASKLTNEDEIASANVYIEIFGLITSRGPRFPSNEVNRVKKSFATELSEGKRKALQLKLNILQSFIRPAVDQNPHGRDEL